MRGSAIGTFFDQDAAMEYRSSAFVGQTAPQKMAGSIFGDVPDVQAGVDMATATGNEAAIRMNVSIPDILSILRASPSQISRIKFEISGNEASSKAATNDLFIMSG